MKHLVFLFFLLLVSPSFAEQSDLWGHTGEKWTPQSRLPDFSFAGYHCGEKVIPNVVVKGNVKDYGAKGDGEADDTQAFIDAVQATHNGALFVPAGTYKLSQMIDLDKSNLVLRGAGQDKTTLLFMAHVPKDPDGRTPFGGRGMLNVPGQKKGKKQASIIKGADRGSKTLHLSSTQGLSVGQFVRLKMRNPSDQSLAKYLYAGLSHLTDQRKTWYAGRIVDWVVRIEHISGNVITLARPLRLDVRAVWNPEIWSFKPTVEEVGIEDLSIQFPGEQWPGHFRVEARYVEKGYFAIYFGRVFNSWIRNVTVLDADKCVELSGSVNVTVNNVVLKTNHRKLTDAEKDPYRPGAGHYGIACGGISQDNLITNIDIQTVFAHNLSLSSFSNGNVYSKIKTVRARFDGHGAAAYENLFTEIEVVETANDFFKSGGNRKDEPSVGARNTYWNIRGKNFPAHIPMTPETKVPKWTMPNFVGVNIFETQKPKGFSPDPWIEKWAGEKTVPTNLYEAQLKRRLEANRFFE